MNSAQTVAAFGAALVLAVSAPVLAQAPAGAPRPPGQGGPPGAGGPPRTPSVVSKDPAVTVAGVYKMDPNHTSIIARMAHAGGYSLSTYRFGKSAGTLTWNPSNIEASKIEVTVETGSIMTPVVDFATELTSDRYLNAALYPQMKFVSTSIQRTGPTTGKISGNLTFNGQTHPLVIDAALVGGGKNGRGVPVIGFTGTAKFKRSEWGFTAGGPGIGEEIELILDAEFNQPQS